MFKFGWLQHALTYGLCMVAFVIPFQFIYSTIALIVLGVIWALQVDFKEFLEKLHSRKTLWVWILYFVMHIISHAYSIDKDESLFDLQKKIALFALPILIGAGMDIDRQRLEKIGAFFTVGVSLTALYCIIRACIMYHYTHATDQFFYHALINGLDASAVYQSLYAVFSISLLLIFPWTVLKTWMKAVMLLLQIAFLILLSARTLLFLFFVLVLPIYIFETIRKRRQHFAYIVLQLLLAGSFVFLIMKTDNPIKSRYAEILHPKKKFHWNFDYKHSKIEEYNNLMLRVFFWRVAVDNINEHKLWIKGAGNGSIYALQNKKMDEYGVVGIYDEKNRSPLYNINIHNMYLQTLMMLGVPGLLLFLFMVLSPLAYIWKNDYAALSFLFHAIVGILFLQESSLQTQAGVIFFSFFAMLIYNYCNTTKERKTLIPPLPTDAATPAAITAPSIPS